MGQRNISKMKHLNSLVKIKRETRSNGE